MMTEQLPISIKINTGLIEVFSRLEPVINKLEAHVNFQTLAAGWYGDEENITFITLSLETPTSFLRQQKLAVQGHYTCFADDVYSLYDKESNQINCYICITATEQALLSKQDRILSAFIQTKLLKVLNLIAVEQNLSPI